jgi:ubiquinone biosynthesis protein UbiJ
VIKTKPLLEIDPPTYLRQVLPALLAKAEAPALKDAVIQFLVVDRTDCDLVYRFSATGLEVVAGVSDEVDLTLAFVSGDLVDFAKQKLDMPRALRTKRLKIHGDTALLEWMADRLSDASRRGVA